jgi:hypothetical protein
MTTFFRHDRQRGPVNALQMRLQGRPETFTELLPGLPFVAMQRCACSSARACILIHRRALTLTSDEGCMPRIS